MKHSILALVLAAALLMSLAVPVAAQETEPEQQTVEKIEIGTVEELLDFAASCTLDTWSQNKQVVLTQDLSLEGVAFTPIPTFGGSFDGQGHTISGLSITQSLSPAGLFGILQPSGKVENLTVLGQICPDGDGLRVGGIVGENYGTLVHCSFSGTVKGKIDTGGIAGTNDGTLQDCQAQGSITGKKRTGGIVGYNSGTVSGGRSEARINIESVDPAVDVKDLHLDLTIDLAQKADRDTLDAPSDTGGIAGYSSGSIINCIYTGSVGYPHIGYNLGGIVGRTSGFISQCRNEGSITGRKDAGGIAGQIEPHIQTVLSQDYIETLSKQFDSLGGLVSQAGSNGAGFGGQVQSCVQAIGSYQSSAREALEELAAGAGDGEINRDALSQLGSAVHGMAGASGELRGTIGQGVDTLAGDINSISNQIGAISRTFALATEEAQKQIITDISDVDLDDISEGRVVGCINTGTVEADLNVGGITGIMGLESTADPEDDVGGSKLTQRKRYELKAIVEDCENLATITGKRSYVGSICGRMELGLIINSRGYGKAISEDGDYVGGIAGLAGGTIRQCLAKCSLSGGSYVGGIVGSGITEDYGGNSSLVTGCYSMVEIPQANQYYGAIAGAYTGTYAENYFVSDTLAGINQVSYQALAEPITYAQLSREEMVPSSLKVFTLSFVVEGKTVKTVPFHYGESFDYDVYPKLPQKEGCYARWSDIDLQDLRFDTVVEATYYPFLTSLSSAQHRDGDQAIAFVQGKFQEGDALELTPGTTAFDGEVVEQWKISVPADGQQTHTIRYLPTQEDVQVYVLRSGSWSKVPFQQMGSYLAFSADGAEVEFAIVSAAGGTGSWIWVVVSVVALGALIAGLVMRKKRQKSGKKSRWLLVVLVLLAVLVLVGVLGAWLCFPGTKAGQGIQAYDVIKTYMSQPRHSLSFQADAQMENKTVTIKAQIDTIPVKSGHVTCIREGSRALYYYNNVVFLENGSAFQLNNSAPDYAQVLQLMQTVYQKAKLTSVDNLFTLTVDGSQATQILKLLMPQAQALLPTANNLTVDMRTDAGELSQLRFTAAGNLTDSVKTPFALSAQLSVQPPQQTLTLPPAAEKAVTTGAYQPQELYSDDLVQLLEAWTQMKNQDVLCADVTLQAQCGPLDVDDTFQFCQWSTQGTTVRGIRRGDLALYVTDSGVYDEHGRLATAAAAKTPDMAKLADIALDNMEHTAFQCRQEDGKSIYTFTVNPTGMKQILLAVFPQAQELNLGYGEGSLEAVIDQGKLSQLRLGCGGSGALAGLRVDIQLSLEANLYEPVPVPVLPEAVQKVIASESQKQ